MNASLSSTIRRWVITLVIAPVIGAIGTVHVAGADSAGPPMSRPPTSQPLAAHGNRVGANGVGERVPSDDPVLKDFHCLGLVDGRVNLFRCACPVRDIARRMSTSAPSDDELAAAQARFKRMADLGIRTVISFQDPEESPDDAKSTTASAPTTAAKADELRRSLALEKSACESVGIHFKTRPMSNAGPHSLQTLSDDQVQTWLDAVTDEILADSKTGGVVFHCSAGHDRTGIVTAYIRMKYQHWPVDEAIAEMRRYGHNWIRYSANGGQSSWHEDHLRAIARMLQGGAK